MIGAGLMNVFMGREWKMEKCKRCGKCCIDIPCFLSKEILKDNGKCSALEFNDNQYSCGLCIEPSKYIDLGPSASWKDKYFSEMIKNLMGVGTFCDSKHSPIDLVKSIIHGVSDEIAECILWERTVYPMGQTSIIRKQLTDFLIETQGIKLSELKPKS